VASALQALQQAALSVGIDPELARMTGSGACLFLPVQNAALGLEIVSRLPVGQGAGELQARVVQSLDRHPLRDWAFDAG